MHTLLSVKKDVPVKRTEGIEGRPRCLYADAAPRRWYYGDLLRCGLHGRRDRAAALSEVEARAAPGCGNSLSENDEDNNENLINHSAVALLCRIRAANHFAAVR